MKIAKSRVIQNASRSSTKDGGITIQYHSISAKKATDKSISRREAANISILSTSNRKASQQPSHRNINLRTPHSTDKKIERNSTSLSTRYRALLSSKEKKEKTERVIPEFDLIPHKKRNVDESYFHNHESIDEADEADQFDSSNDNYELLESALNGCHDLRKESINLPCD